MKKKKIGLALGSGAAKGLAHIGVIKVLEAYRRAIFKRFISSADGRYCM